jgi:hypothetical protein
MKQTQQTIWPIQTPLVMYSTKREIIMLDYAIGGSSTGSNRNFMAENREIQT